MRSGNQLVPKHWLKRRHFADVRKWIFYLVMWMGIMGFGVWTGLRYGHLKTGLILGGALVGIGLVYSLFVLGWHVQNAVQTEVSPTHPGVQRVTRLLQPLCDRAGIRMPMVFLISTEAPNACAVGMFSRTQSVGVTLGALAMLTDEELTAVLAHEVTHLQRKDVFFDGWWIALTGIAVWLGAITMAMGIATLVSAQGERNKKDGESAAGLGIFLILLGIVFGVVCVLILKLIQHLVMRRAEYMADGGAVLLTGQAKPLIRALTKLESASNPLFDRPTALSMVFSVSATSHRSWWDRLFDTHPRTSKRIRRLERLSQELGEL